MNLYWGLTQFWVVIMRKQKALGIWQDIKAQSISLTFRNLIAI